MQPSKWKALSLNKAKQKEQIKLKPTTSKVLQFTQTLMDAYEYDLTFHNFLFYYKNQERSCFGYCDYKIVKRNFKEKKKQL